MLSTTNVVLIYVVEDFYSRRRLGDVPMRDERKDGGIHAFRRRASFCFLGGDGWLLWVGFPFGPRSRAVMDRCVRILVCTARSGNTRVACRLLRDSYRFRLRARL